MLKDSGKFGGWNFLVKILGRRFVESWGKVFHGLFDGKSWTWNAGAILVNFIENKLS